MPDIELLLNESDSSLALSVFSSLNTALPILVLSGSVRLTPTDCNSVSDRDCSENVTEVVGTVSSGGSLTSIILTMTNDNGSLLWTDPSS